MLVIWQIFNSIYALFWNINNNHKQHMHQPLKPILSQFNHHKQSNKLSSINLILILSIPVLGNHISLYMLHAYHISNLQNYHHKDDIQRVHMLQIFISEKPRNEINIISMNELTAIKLLWCFSSLVEGLMFVYP